MDIPAGTGFITSLVGGVVVAAANWIFGGAQRKKTLAEADESRARADDIRAQTTERMRKSKPARSEGGNWGEPPKGWLAGDIEGASHDYVVGVDQVQMHSGRASAYIRATSSDPEGFGALSQRFRAKPFLGKRLKLTGYLRVASVAGWAGLWMRVDGPDNDLLGFDNMEKRPVAGSSEWVKREIVLSVPEEAVAVAIGAILVGSGQVWVDDFSLEVVGNHVPLTVPEEQIPEGPVNLNFEIH